MGLNLDLHFPSDCNLDFENSDLDFALDFTYTVLFDFDWDSDIKFDSNFLLDLDFDFGSDFTLRKFLLELDVALGP